MSTAPIPIAVTEDARGLVVGLPPRFWLLVGLRKLFPRMLAEPAAWTYRLPPTVGAAKRLEIWIAEVAIQIHADARRRAWTASDAEWEGAAEPAPAPTPPAAEPVVVMPPGERTGPAVLALLRALADGAVMVAGIETDGARRYRLEPSGQGVRASVAERAIRERLIVPGRDGLFGPELSQTWRGASPAEIAASALKPARPRKVRAARPRNRSSAGSAPGTSQEARG